MIQVPGVDGVAFTEASDGDQRSDQSARQEVASLLGLSAEWATVRQVHGTRVVRVDAPDQAGDADALWTSVERLPLAVFTADCFGVVLVAQGAVGVAHSGWRGAHRGVVVALRRQMERAGYSLGRAAVGPGIGPCCFEVGGEVAERFESHQTTTSWGTLSVALPGALGDQLGGLSVAYTGACTRHEGAWFSHRRDGTLMRLATIGWVT